MQSWTAVIQTIDTGGTAKTLMQTREAGGDYRFAWKEYKCGSKMQTLEIKQ